jgi:hypothetical protein
MRDQQRRATKARAEGDLADRVAHFHAKSTAKDELAARRMKVRPAARCRCGRRGRYGRYRTRRVFASNRVVWMAHVHQWRVRHVPCLAAERMPPSPSLGSAASLSRCGVFNPPVLSHGLA